MKTKFIILFLTVVVNYSCNSTSNHAVVEKRSPVVYKSDNAIFFNPERGFYKHTSCNPGSAAGSLNEITLKSYKNNNISLVLRLFYLKDFRDKPLSDAALKEFDADMQLIRESGLKCILRFAYSEGVDQPDAPLHIIEQHLDQLRPYLEKNSDVIAVMQAGLIGAWGEWYYSSNNLNNSAGRNAVLKKILEVLPQDRMVQVRTPAYKKDYLKRIAPLTASEAFSQNENARIGHHNDCFLASPTDYGTYENAQADKAYLNEECLYVPIGGETCPPSGINPADGIRAQQEMRFLRWTYLNQDYYRGVNDIWIADGNMDDIIRNLGYRFELISGEYSTEVSKGGSMYAEIKLRNVGYAPLFNKRNVELVLRNPESKEEYKVVLDTDPRFWHPDEQTNIKAEIGIPETMEAGEYKLYLNLPDMAGTLSSNPDYSIRFANKNTWDTETGYNDLHHIVEVQPDSGNESYTHNLYFIKQ